MRGTVYNSIIYYSGDSHGVIGMPFASLEGAKLYVEERIRTTRFGGPHHGRWYDARMAGLYSYTDENGILWGRVYRQEVQP